MSYREILIYLSPDDSAAHISRYAAEMACNLKARAVGVIVESDAIDFSKFDSAILDRERREAFDLMVKRRAELHEAAVRAGAAFEAAAKQRAVPYDKIFERSHPEELPDMVTRLARLYDCCIMPSAEESDGLQIALIEEVLFGSGRPLILIPRNRPVPGSLDVVVVAWDGSRAAARAVNDSMAILRRAAGVEVVTIIDEKPLNNVPSGAEMVRHLEAHGIVAHCTEVGFGGSSIGEQIMREALRLDASLLIMGAYGHSRLRQIVFGGATRTIVRAPELPILVSH